MRYKTYQNLTVQPASCDGALDSSTKKKNILCPSPCCLEFHTGSETTINKIRIREDDNVFVSYTDNPPSKALTTHMPVGTYVWWDWGYFG